MIECVPLELYKLLLLDDAFFDKALKLVALECLRDADRRVIFEPSIAVGQVIIVPSIFERSDQRRSRIEARDAKRGEARKVVCLGKSKYMELRFIGHRISNSTQRGFDLWRPQRHE